jgi:hypothetical protein
VLDRRADPLQQLGQLLRAGCRIVRGVQQVAQLVLAGLELDQLGGERLDAPAALLLAEGAGLEGVQVAVDRRFGLADLAADRVQLFLLLLAQGRGLVAGGADGAFEQVGLLVGMQQSGAITSRPGLGLLFIVGVGKSAAGSGAWTT